MFPEELKASLWLKELGARVMNRPIPGHFLLGKLIRTTSYQSLCQCSIPMICLNQAVFDGKRPLNFDASDLKDEEAEVARSSEL